MIRGHYASYDTNYFNLSNSIAYVASTIGSLQVPILVGVMDKTPCAVCTVGEWGLRLRHYNNRSFELVVVSFSKKEIEHIVSGDSDTQFKTFANYFFCASEFGERDIRTIPFLEELYDEFPIRSLFDSLNAFCNHSLDGKDADITRPEDIVISASARRFLESRLENNDTVESSPSRSADEDNILTSDTSILDYNFNVNESNSNFDKTKTDSTGNTTATVTRSRTTRCIPRFRAFTVQKESDWMAFRPEFYPKQYTKLQGIESPDAERLASILPQVVMISHYLQNTVVDNALHWSEAAEDALPQRLHEMKQAKQMQRLTEKAAGENSLASFLVNTSTESKQCEAGKLFDTNVLIFCNCTQNGRDAPQNQSESLHFFERQRIQKNKIGQKTVSYSAYGMKNTCKGRLQDVIICLEALSERKNQYLLNVDADVGIQRLLGRYFATTPSDCFNHFLKGGCQAESYIQGNSFLGQYNNSA